MATRTKGGEAVFHANERHQFDIPRKQRSRHDICLSHGGGPITAGSLAPQQWGLYYSHNDVCALQHFKQLRGRFNKCPMGPYSVLYLMSRHFNGAGLGLHRKPCM